MFPKQKNLCFTNKTIPQRLKSRGFTLLEMIVVVAIFSLMVVVISSILKSVFASRKVVVAKERLQSDSNSIVEIIGKDLRSFRLYYPWYDDHDAILDHPWEEDLTTAQPVKSLALIDEDENMVFYRKSEAEGNCGGRDPDICLVIGTSDVCLSAGLETKDPSCWPNISWVNITPSNVELVDIDFYIEPLQDPFEVANNIDKQPLITVVLKTRAEISPNQGQVSNTIQTTVSSRTYQER